ncbi:MAG: VOC family protein [Verrucomicrobiota bacterium]
MSESAVLSQPAVQAVPDGMNTVTPHLICDGAAAAIEFYKKAFGAEELMRLPGADGRLMHACLNIGNSRVMLVDENPQWGALGPKALNGSSVTLHLQLEDADAMFARATAAGAKVILPIDEMFWGDRYGIVEDPWGHRWSLATHVRDLSPEEIEKAAPTSCCQG